MVADLPSPPPLPPNPATLEPAGPDDLAALFPADLILQEVATDRHLDIPDVYRLWRPTPLHRAGRLERGTPARIYQGVSPAGSHKPNTAVPQAYYNARQGIRRLTTETGAPCRSSAGPGAPMVTLIRWNDPCSTARRTS